MTAFFDKCNKNDTPYYEIFKGISGPKKDSVQEIHVIHILNYLDMLNLSKASLGIKLKLYFYLSISRVFIKY